MNSSYYIERARSGRIRALESVRMKRANEMVQMICGGSIGVDRFIGRVAVK